MKNGQEDLSNLVYHLIIIPNCVTRNGSSHHTTLDNVSYALLEVQDFSQKRDNNGGAGRAMQPLHEFTQYGEKIWRS